VDAVRTETRHFVTLAVEGLPDLALFVVTDTMISPQHVRIVYTWQRQPDEKTQPVTIEVSGLRRLRNGELDNWRSSVRTHFSSADRSQWPDWLPGLVTEHAPSGWAA